MPGWKAKKVFFPPELPLAWSVMPLPRLLLRLGLAAACLVPSAGCETTRIMKTEVVAGLVIDARTRAPIAGAEVMFLDRRDTLTVTDGKGEFICGPGYMKVPVELAIPVTLAPETRIRVSARGYVTRVIQAYPRVEWTRKSQMKKPGVLVVRLEAASPT